MKFTFSNLGAIDQAELELLPLTIVSGPNNTGKTYVTYATYALLKAWRRLVDWEIPPASMQILLVEGVLKLDLQEIFVLSWAEIRQGTARNWKSFLPLAFAAPEQRFDNTRLEFDFPLTESWVEHDYETESTSDQGKVIFTAKKPAFSTEIEIAALREPGETPWPQYALEDFVRQAMLDAVLGSYMPTVFMASAERTGAAIFKDELNLTKNKIVGLLSQLDKDKNLHITPTALLDAVYKRGYALPVDDNVRFVNTFQTLEGEVGRFISEFPNLLDDFKEISGGSYTTNKEGNTYFIPKGSRTKLALTEASSAVRSLLVLWYWLNNIAAKGHILMIDEPELNLHPINQRRMARFLVKLVNAGIKVFVTTHSDYIIKEFNTLIMLNRQLPHFDKIRKKFGYQENESLSPEHVALYMTRNGGTKRKPVKTLERAKIQANLGLEATTFDDSIDEMNQIQDEIRYGG